MTIIVHSLEGDRGRPNPMERACSLGAKAGLDSGLVVGRGVHLVAVATTWLYPTSACGPADNCPRPPGLGGSAAEEKCGFLIHSGVMAEAPVTKQINQEKSIHICLT